MERGIKKAHGDPQIRVASIGVSGEKGVKYACVVNDMDRAAAVDVAVEALFEAADEDSATGGPDPIRGIYPVVAAITASGYERVEDADLAVRTQALIDRRRED